MEITKVFSSHDGEERLYSVLMSEDELRYFSLFGKKEKKRIQELEGELAKQRNIANTTISIAGRNLENQKAAEKALKRFKKGALIAVPATGAAMYYLGKRNNESRQNQ